MNGWQRRSARTSAHKSQTLKERYGAKANDGEGAWCSACNCTTPVFGCVHAEKSMYCKNQTTRSVAAYRFLMRPGCQRTVY